MGDSLVSGKASLCEPEASHLTDESSGRGEMAGQWTT